MRSFLEHLLLCENIKLVASRITGNSSFAFWFNPKTNKAFIVPRGSARNGPWHATVVAQDPSKFGLNKKRILEYMKRYDEDYTYHTDFDQTTESFYSDIVNRVKDTSDGIDILMGEMDYFRCTFSPSLAVISAQCGGMLKHVVQDVSVWKKLVEHFSILPKDRLHAIHLIGFDRPQGDHTSLERDAFDFFLKYGKIPQRTEIGRTMAQFREELSEKSEYRYHYILDTQRKTIAFGPLTEKSAKEILETRFRGNRNFVIVDSNVLHKVGDVIRI
jgi:hypothetical protein